MIKGFLFVFSPGFSLLWSALMENGRISEEAYPSPGRRCGNLRG